MSKERKQTFGRPTIYNEELANLICERVASHGCGLNELCKKFSDMPNPDTIYSWRAKYEHFSESFLAARKIQGHALFETSLNDLAEIKDYYYDDPKTGARCVDSGIVAAQKAIAQHKLGMAAKLRPKDYGVTSVEEANNESNAKEVAEHVAKIMKESEKEY
jgi:hypothetical protein